MKSFGLFRPYCADVFVRGETLESLEPAGEIIGYEEAVQVRLQLSVRGVVIPFHRGGLDGSVHALHLPVCPRMLGLGESVVDSVLIAAAIEHMRDPRSRRSVAIPGWMT